MEKLVFGSEAAAKVLKVSRRTIDRMIAANDFPEPIQAAGGKKPRRVWLESDLVEFSKKKYGDPEPGPLSFFQRLFRK